MFEQYGKIYMVNMDEHPGRWEAFDQEAKRNGINYERFAGIKINGGKTRIDREAGCRASHMTIIQMAKDAGLPNVLIFEDDAVIDERLSELEPYVKEFLDVSTWDMFYYGCNHNDIFEPVNEHIIRVRKAWTTHSYVVNARAYDKILQYKDTPEPVDVVLTRIHAEGNSFCVFPRMIFQREGQSYILDQPMNYDPYLKDK